MTWFVAFTLGLALGFFGHEIVRAWRAPARFEDVDALARQRQAAPEVEP